MLAARIGSDDSAVLIAATVPVRRKSRREVGKVGMANTSM
jgi:hypothetical protein